MSFIVIIIIMISIIIIIMHTDQATLWHSSYESVKNSSLVEDIDPVDPSQAKVTSGRSCFNCLGDHHMTDCTKAIDRKAIAENRRKLQSKQQYVGFFKKKH